MSGGQTDPDLIADILDVLDRHGYARSDNEHAARAIGLISDLARICQGSQDHPFGPSAGEVPSRTGPEPSGPAARYGVVLSDRDISTVVAALDDASGYKRDRAATCADCADQSCGTCQWRLEAAETYDSLATLLGDIEQTRRAEASSQSQPAADREAGQ